MNPAEKSLYLASKSPRRKELLRQIGVNFEILLLRDSAERGSDVSEIVLPNELPADYVARVTAEKATVGGTMMQKRNLPNRPILAADTTVVLDNCIYGKPATPAQAHAMLTTLSGQTHQVMTSIAIFYQDQLWQTTQTSSVTFCTLDPAQITSYCASTEPYDKAGGYGIQGAAARFISHISGSYSGIMGLPLFETAQLLHKVGL